jgi:hypothetical protein
MIGLCTIAVIGDGDQPGLEIALRAAHVKERNGVVSLFRHFFLRIVFPRRPFFGRSEFRQCLSYVMAS